jgi:RNase H-like domain found in reverse transcriptase
MYVGTTPRRRVVAFGSCALKPAQRKYHITRLEALAFIWTLGHFHAYLSSRAFLWRTDHRALKYIFDASKTQIPVLQRYKLIADDYQFVTEWIPGSRMVADVFSRLCIVPADRMSSMSNREMVMADLTKVIPTSPTFEETEIAYFNMMDEDDIIVEEFPTQEEEDNAIDLNIEGQTLHTEEEEIRGKMAINVPTFTATERYLLGATAHIRRYLENPDYLETITDQGMVHQYRKHAKSLMDM